MKRILLGLLLGALIFGVAFAGAKVATVTNPMNAPLDGGGYPIANVGNITANADIASNGYVLGTSLVATQGQVILEPPGVPLRTIESGNVDPTVAPGVFANVGSLYLGTSGLWRKTGGTDTDWTRVA